jgi:hypothetical protein
MPSTLSPPPAGPLGAIPRGGPKGSPPVDTRPSGVPRASVDLAERAQPTLPGECRWRPMAIKDLTMVAAESSLAADPLFHAAPGGHRGRIQLRYWYFRPELKYLTCQACAEDGGRSVVPLEELICQHRPLLT